jgi:hypothetical protein
LQWLTDHQNADGSWNWNREHPDDPFSVPDVWITSLATLAFLNHGIDESDTTVGSSIGWLLLQQRADGAIATEASDDSANNTALAILALIATRNTAYDDEITSAINYLLSIHI